jgi:hypothetical protein
MTPLEIALNDPAVVAELERPMFALPPVVEAELPDAVDEPEEDAPWPHIEKYL